ncbi:MAG: BTAD domain-containing putative transcriptional regulator [Anaerolineaceae bacterium]|nr:BTAD domain-containing putative transcriptional regulator [Anaerolineaceae bacterium]MDD4043132.1 BTAD domain-containing putative transcriptional regulator [Anaerolineaceae bacterium]MDD4578114.1 BTAD domain-containing putative transcriptional regulator [Anaerolineaceae bacterium]
MTNRNQIILSKLTPPAQRSAILARPRVQALLKNCLSYPLTVLTCETGYGKTTSALTLTQSLNTPVFWYTVSRNERDPRLFLTYLCTAFNQGGKKLGQPAMRVLEDSQANFQECLIVLLNSLCTGLTQPALLVLDDFQGIQDSGEVLEMVDWFIEHLPGNLHVMILSRLPVGLPSMNKWRIQGKLLEFDKDSLSFTPAETRDLYNFTYQLNLDAEDVSLLHQRTEGWAIGLQVVWQSIKASPESLLDDLLEEKSVPSLANLFAYLAEEVLDMQTEEHKEFLIDTSILQFLDSDTCDFLMDTQDSASTLNELYKSGLFIEQLKPDVLRYHYIFREFLLAQLNKNPEKAKALHRKVASYYSAHHYWERAIAHLISAKDYARIRQILDDVGDRLLQSGLKQSVRFWLEQIPAVERGNYPFGNYLLGEIDRMEANFDQALESYRTAQRLYQNLNNAWGTSLAMRGQAQVYLDTLRPVNANQLLDRALALLDPLEYPLEVASLLTQIAENHVNQGALLDAERSLQKARELSSHNAEAQSFIQARLYLRAGRLEEGLRLLQKLEPGLAELSVARPQRFHREASLLLSLFYSLGGEPHLALQYAEKGLQVSRQLQANYVEALAKIRLGHALQLDLQQGLDAQGIQQIRELYEYAIQNVDIVRIHVEPLWGLCRLVGYAGHLEEARQIADKALIIAGNAGDEWIGLMVRISLGAALAEAGDYDSASDILSVADSLADKVHDRLAKAASLLWEAYTAQKQGYTNSAILFLEQSLGLIQQHNYQFLLTQPSLLGSDDPYTFFPLLCWAREKQIQPELVNQLLPPSQPGGNYHPGYSLGIKLLGGFEVRKGKKLVGSETWKREKARQMLQALALNRAKGISKDQLSIYFWPNADETTANNNFKVTLSALNQALEPDRPAKESPLFVIRNGEQYQLNPNLYIYLDIDHFEKLALSPDLEDQQAALDLYDGRLLEGEPLQEFFMPEVHYFHRLYLQSLGRAIETAIQAKEFEYALELSNRLVRQEPLLEAGYQYQMQIYHALGNLAMLRKVYQQALDVYHKEYGPRSEPEELMKVFAELTGHD